MNNDIGITSIVCCYGLAIKEKRLEEDWNGIVEYAKGILSYLKTCPDHTIVIICGGFTDPTETVSEAESMHALFVSLEPKFDTMYAVYPEEVSSSTTENLFNAMCFLENLAFKSDIKFQPDVVTIFCDMVRAKKVEWICSQYFRKGSTVVGINRPDTHPRSTPEAQAKALEKLKNDWSQT